MIAYIANGSPSDEFCRLPDGCQWRMVDPRTGDDELIMPVSGIPLNISWDSAYQQVHYRVGGKFYRADWQVGATAEEVLTLPETLTQEPQTIEDIWQDAASGKWRLKALEHEGVGTELHFIASAWEYAPFSGQWIVLEKQLTECGCGDCPCALVMNKWVQSVPRMALRDLLDNMRVSWHLERAQPDELWAEGPREFLSIAFPNSSYGFELVFGDSYHAMAPFVLNIPGNDPQTIYPKGDPCGNQLAFMEEEGFLLLTAEYSGACARIVNLQSGTIITALPESAKHTVWVNRPAR